MSFAGIVQFRDNLNTLMETEAFKEAGDGDKLLMGSALINSKFGICGKKLPIQKKED